MFILTFITASSQAQQLPFAQLSIADGLEDMVVFDIQQDDYGFLWMTTRTGVNRFDGNQFWTYNRDHGLQHNLVRDLLKASNGDLWAATEAGLARFDGRQFQPILTDIWPNNVPCRAVIESQDGTIWVATYGMGILQIDTTDSPKIVRQFNLENNFPSNNVRSLMQAQDGSIWAGDSNQVYRIIDGQFEIIDWHATPSEKRVIFQTHDGSIWVGTRQGIAVYDGSAFVPMSFGDKLKNLAINGISKGDGLNVWVSTRDWGAFKFDENLQLLKHLHMGNGLPDNSVNHVFHDSENNIWFGTYGGGVARLSTDDVLNWKAQAEMPNPNVYAITEDDNGCVWIGTNGDGISSLCDGKLTHITTEDGLSHNKVLTSLIDHNGVPWFGTLQGVTYIKDNRFYTLDTTDGLSGPVVYHMALASDNSIWMATNNGLNKYHHGQFDVYDQTDGLPGNRINRVYQGKDNQIWLGTSGGLSLMKDGQFTNWDISDGLAANFINDIYEDQQGLIWLATNNGLSSFDGEQFKTWTTAEGLPHNNTTTILPGNHDELWIGTSRGVAIFDGQTFTVITSREGLVFDLVNRSAGYRDQEGNIWFGTGEGISRFDSSFEPGSSQPPPVHLLSVKNETSQLDLSQHVTLNQDESNLSFNFTAISFQRAPDVNFRYRLGTASESNWRHTRLKEIQINSLASGDYTFEVTARIGNGEWNPNTSRFNFSVAPPFWLTPWFLLLMLILMVSAIFYRSRRNHQHALHLELLVQERTQQLEEVNRGLDWMANHDSLTRLSNRHHVQQIISSYQSTDELLPLGIVAIDIDHFKQVNDQYGHAFGDLALKKFAQLIQNTVPKGHMTARWGGEEFLIISPQIQLNKLRVLVKNILEQCPHLDLLTDEGERVSLYCSLGFVHLTNTSDNMSVAKQIEKAIQLADKALYQAKQNGRNQICGYEFNPDYQILDLNAYLTNNQSHTYSKQINEFHHP